MAIIEQKIRTKCSRLCAYFQAITKKKNKKRQMILVICRLLSEWGDSNARPLRPERSALPTALHSAIGQQRDLNETSIIRSRNVIDTANIKQKNIIEKFLKNFCKNICTIKNFALPLHTQNHGAIAQLVEQRTENPCVPGSIPGGTTWKSESYRNVTLFFYPPKWPKSTKTVHKQGF